MNATLSMNFGNTIEPMKMWSTVYVRGERGSVVGYDAENFAEPMTRVLFADGRVGLFKAIEFGLR